jgi:CrcB protein
VSGTSNGLFDVVLVAGGSGAGSVVRYATDRIVQARHSQIFPWGILAVNIVGSAVLGALIAAAAQGRLSAGALLLVGTGFCGGLTTFSTFAWDTNILAEDGAFGLASANVLASLAVGIGSAGCSYAAFTALLR